jgi:NSS family neurotransmitter:Na+ symporter
MMPTLFVLLLVIVVAAWMLPGASKGIDFLLKPDFSKVNSDVFLGALGQCFYSLSIGMGCLCTYASYFSRHTNITTSAIQIGLIDLMVALLAGLMIFPAAFSVGINPDSGPSLIFITLPNVFNQAFSGVPLLGWAVSLMFYALLFLAALTSLISLHEVNTAFFYEELHISRKAGAWIVTVFCCIIGALCSISVGHKSGLSLFGLDLLDLFDFVTGQLMLPTVGLFMCLFVGWYIPKQIVIDELSNWGTLKFGFYKLFIFTMRFVCPLCILAIMLHQFGVI